MGVERPPCQSSLSIKKLVKMSSELYFLHIIIPIIIQCVLLLRYISRYLHPSEIRVLAYLFHFEGIFDISPPVSTYQKYPLKQLKNPRKLKRDSLKNKTVFPKKVAKSLADQPLVLPKPNISRTRKNLKSLHRMYTSEQHHVPRWPLICRYKWPKSVQ